MRPGGSRAWIAMVMLSAAASALTCTPETPPLDVGPRLLGAQSLSLHYVEAIFDRRLDASYEDPSLYLITGPDGEQLAVESARVREDGARMLLATGPQREVQYELSLRFDAPAEDPGAKAAPIVSFMGSAAPEPYLSSALALSPTSVLATFSVAMDNNIEVHRFYEIADPDLDIFSATAGSGWTTALLTTSEQDNINYTLRVTNVTSSGGAKLIDPTRCTAVFNGIAPNEPPVILGAQALSATSVLVSFNKPLADAAADPTRFSIEPSLVVTLAEMSTFNTQIKLTTLPMTAGQTYTLTATGLKDRSGNSMGGPPDNQATFTFAGGPQTDGAEAPRILPRVIGASSTSNTSVMIVFNKPMGDSALNAANYVIVQESVNSEVGTLRILDNICAAGSANAGAYCVEDADCPGGTCLLRGPRFLGPGRTSVLLTTSSQNEVTYRIKAVNVQDLSGNELAPQELLVDPTSATFPGTPPAGGELVDSDGDGLLDNAELRGWTVVFVDGNGEITRKEVTSDPHNPDTDGDGLDDSDEKQINTDPRSPDTDGDNLNDYDEFNVWYSSPLHQDTDADGLDDNLEISFFRTSALLDDTDGDGLQDGDEVITGNRNPLIADLPEPAISIGEMALRLDTRFQYTDTHGVKTETKKEVQATLTQSQEQTLKNSDTETNKHVIEGGFEGGLDQGKGTAKVTVKYGFTHESTFQAEKESKQATQNQYQESLSTGVERDITQEVQRTVVGAGIDLVVTLGNFGDIPFTMSNIEVTALLQDPYNRRRFTPVASLLPASQLAGQDFSVHLGPFINERGPFIFKSTEVFPSLVEDLMKNPRGLIFKVANFDVVDERGRNFAFISQDVNDRTAGLIIDYGNGQVDRYRIATHSEFDDSGRPKGITMAYALQQILGMRKNAPQDAITVGANGCAETFASGDDVQVVAPVCFPVTPGGTIIEPGPNGILESVPVGDDHKSPDGLRIVDGGDGCAHTRSSRDDIQVVPGDCASGGVDGVVILAGPNGVIDTTPRGDDLPAGVSGYATEFIGTCDGNTVDQRQIIEPPFGGNGIANSRARAGTDDQQLVPVGTPVAPRTVIIDPGPNGILESKPLGDEIRLGPGALCSGDGDCPGGGICRTLERLVRVGSVQNVPEEARLWIVLAPEDVDTGVNFDDLPLRAGHTYSLAFVQDQDMDGLTDREEYLYGSSDRDDNSDGCPLGDGAPGCDPNQYDFDTVRDYEEVKTGWRVQIAGWSSYVAYCDPVQPDSDADRLFDDEERRLGTDPGKRDTDEDGISDFLEVRGYEILRRDGALIRNVVPYESAIIVPGQNAVLDTLLVGDDVLGKNSQDQDIITPGPDGLLQSVPDKDDRIEGTFVILDGGNGIPETTASNRDVQVGPSPVANKTVTVTFVDFAPGDSCDDAGSGDVDGEFYFDLRVRKGVETIAGQHTEKAVINRFDTFHFGGVIIDNGNGVSNTTAEGDDVQVVANGAAVAPGGVIITPGENGKLDTVTLGGDDVALAPTAQFSVEVGPDNTVGISASIIEDDPVCDDNTRNTIIEPADGNGLADTLAQNDDLQLIALGAGADAGDTIISSCPPGTDGVLDSTPGSPGLCEPVIVAGTNGTADTTLLGDDVARTPPGAPPWPADAAVVAPGPNGRIDSIPGGDDAFVPARVPLACEAVIIEPTTGGNGTVDTTAVGDDVQVVPVGAPITAGQVIIRPGPNGEIDTIPSADDPGTVDENEAETLLPASVPANNNCATCPSAQCTMKCALCPSEACFGDDTLLLKAQGSSCAAGWLSATPNTECPCGACLQFNSTPQHSTFNSWAPESLRFSPADLASIPADGSVMTIRNGPGCFGSARLRVRIEVSQGVSVTPGSVLVRAGTDDELSTSPAGDDVLGVPHEFLYASNPLDRDTDGDTLFDGAEQTLGANPNDTMDAQRFRDNDLDGLPNGVETDGWFVGYVTYNISIDDQGRTIRTPVLKCLTQTGDMTVTDEFNPPSQCRMVTADPFEPDSDFDGLPDLLEYLLRSDPTTADTDGDGLLDYDEFYANSEYSIEPIVMREFERRCGEAARCAYTPPSGSGEGSGCGGIEAICDPPYGTSVVLADTDADGRNDREEIKEFWITSTCVTQGGVQVPGEPRKVYSSPFSADYDVDGLTDGQERNLQLDPQDPDTDDDGKIDSADNSPNGCGKRVTLSFLTYYVADDCDGVGDGEFGFRFTVNYPGSPSGSKTFSMNADDLDDNETHTFPSSFSVTFSMRPGDTFSVSGHVEERDDGSSDEDWELKVRTYSYDDAVNRNVDISPESGDTTDSNCFSQHKLTFQLSVTQD